MLNHWYKTHKHVVLAVLCFILTTSCVLSKRMVVKQGISGIVTQVTGNQMPLKGKSQSAGKPIVANVYIFENVSLKNAEGQMPLFSKINAKEIAHVKTDSTGKFQLSLPVGKYSLFVKLSEGYFAGETDGYDNINPIEVQLNKVSNRNIVVNIGAAY